MNLHSQGVQARGDPIKIGDLSEQEAVYEGKKLTVRYHSQMMLRGIATMTTEVSWSRL